MAKTDVFQEASRKKVRFKSSLGNLSTEDLWSLPLVSKNRDANLNDIAKRLSKAMRELDEDNFVTEMTNDDKLSELKLKFKVVTSIITCKEEENENRKRLAEAKEKKSKILDIIKTKQDKDLEKLSIKELTKLAENL